MGEKLTPGQDTDRGNRWTITRGRLLHGEFDMTRIYGILAMTLLLAPTPARADELTLRDVIELHRAGLGEDLLIAVIDADAGPFRLSFADIQDLKSDGLSERVIAALVRTGTRRAGIDAAVAPVVQVNQEVITYMPGIIVLGTDPHRDGSANGDPGGPGRGAGRHGESRRVEAPPATWVTRQQDGKNVSASGEVTSSRPAATWVTPRDPKATDTPDAVAPPPKPKHR